MTTLPLSREITFFRQFIHELVDTNLSKLKPSDTDTMLSNLFGRCLEFKIYCFC